jgi:hypothetical protein
VLIANQRQFSYLGDVHHKLRYWKIHIGNNFPFHLLIFCAVHVVSNMGRLQPLVLHFSLPLLPEFRHAVNSFHRVMGMNPGLI